MWIVRLVAVVLVACLACDGSDPQAADSAARGAWAAFADKHRFAVVGPFFFGKVLEIMDGVSYHFPAAWSGRALDEILAKVAQKTSIHQDQIYLFGFSAGAQFAHRYALFRPRRVRAVAAHAAGQYTLPIRYVQARFLITVGSEDESRVKPAEAFVRTARRHGIQARLLQIAGHDHRICQRQLDQSRSFFLGSAGGGSKVQGDSVTTCGGRAYIVAASP